MRLSIRYENQFQSIELNEEETQEMWVSLSLEGENLEKEKLIQKTFDEKFNKLEYNIWHRETRHLTTPKERFNDDGDEYDTSEPLMKEVADDRIFRKDEIERANQDEYESVCQWIRTALGKKQDWADMFIAVRIDGMSIREYATSIGVNENNITQKLKRATKKLEQEYKNRQI
ncbi:sigma-70 family RNA polymerase sigma factor [Erysipelothrix rhusiopathiae]|nr:sigma-70 family RNA polymerase sigma factor [Erysipelothrix rhusiopathiae]MDE8295293.1 sigma-70 family RNA polymerase sigma factor [Erysipelothrix rhusiopathiae]MDE9419000.1 sigma-70 family RNA polymerase sigma factor [Erysipelothrix rhusiopathiae]